MSPTVESRTVESRTVEVDGLGLHYLEAGEGDLRRAAANELKGMYTGTTLTFTEEVESVLPRTAGGAEDDVSRILLAIVAVLLVIELLVAGRFGRRRATG